MKPEPPDLRRTLPALLVLGVASGLPNELTKGTLQAFLGDRGLQPGEIGLLQLAGAAYAVKLLWAPLVDRVSLPWLGRRRGWLLALQLALALGIALLGISDRLELPPWVVWEIDPNTRATVVLALLAAFVAWCGATFDVALNGLTCESLDDRSRTAGAGLSVWGWRIGFALSGGLALALAGSLGWPAVYALLAGVMLLSAAGTLLAPEPPPRGDPPATLLETLAIPLRALRHDLGARRLALVLAFVLLYRIADGMAATQQVVFLRACGFSKEQIGTTRTVLTLIGAALGVGLAGLITWRLGERASLWSCGVLAALSNLLYPPLFLFAPAADGPLPLAGLSAVLLLDNVCAGAVGAAMVGFMMGLCRSACAATQYALLTAIMAFGPYLLAPTGYLAESLGWTAFFGLSALAGVPGLIVLALLSRQAPST